MSFMSKGVGLALTGTARISALMFSLGAATAVGELSLRGCKRAVQVLSGGYLFAGAPTPPKSEEDKNYWDKLQDFVKPYIADITLRPFGDKETAAVVKSAIILTALGITLTDAVNFFEGTPPPIYNKVLSWIGPIRLYEGFYFPQLAGAAETVKETVANAL